jgi:hypothetical protein
MHIDAPRGGETRPGVIVPGVDVIVGAEVAVQEEDVGAVHAHDRQAGVQGGLKLRRRSAGRRLSKLALGGDAQVRRKGAFEGLADHGLAIAIHGRGINEVYARVHGGMHSGHGLFQGGFAPASPQTPAAQRQAAHAGERAELGRLHARALFLFPPVQS